MWRTKESPATASPDLAENGQIVNPGPHPTASPDPGGKNNLGPEPTAIPDPAEKHTILDPIPASRDTAEKRYNLGPHTRESENLKLNLLISN